MGENLNWAGIPRFSPNGIAYSRREPDPFGRGWYASHYTGTGQKSPPIPKSKTGRPLSDDLYYFDGPGLPPIAIWIYERRTAKGLTQTQVGEVCGVAQPIISRWECGHRIPNARHRETLRSLLGDDLPMDGLSRDR